MNFSSNWEGSCNLIKKFNAFNSYYSSNINSLEATIDINGRNIKVAVCNGMNNAVALINRLLKNEVNYD